MNKDLSKLLETGLNMFTNDFQDNSKTYPKYDIYYDNKDLKVIFEVPGLKKDDIKIDFFNILTIKCHKKKLFDKLVFQGEINYGMYERNLNLPISVTSQNNVKIDLKDGILFININVQKELKNKFSMKL